MPKKQRGIRWDFPISILLQNSKKIKGGTLGDENFDENVSQCRKKLKGVFLGIFRHPFCRKTPKTLKGNPLIFFSEKSHNAEKN